MANSIATENVDFVVNFIEENYHHGNLVERAQALLDEKEIGQFYTCFWLEKRRGLGSLFYAIFVYEIVYR